MDGAGVADDAEDARSAVVCGNTALKRSLSGSPAEKRYSGDKVPVVGIQYSSIIFYKGSSHCDWPVPF